MLWRQLGRFCLQLKLLGACRHVTELTKGLVQYVNITDYDRSTLRYEMRALVAASCLCSSADVSLLACLFGAFYSSCWGEEGHVVSSSCLASCRSWVAFSSEVDTPEALRSKAERMSVRLLRVSVSGLLWSNGNEEKKPG